MDERYREIYGAIYEAFTFTGADAAELRLPEVPPDERTRWADTIRSAVETAQDLAGQRLREDAKALLAVNFLNLVVFPLGVADRITGQLEADVHKDIVMLVQHAAAEANSATQGVEISGHRIMDSLSRNWDRLRISRWQLWED
jgi:hypothetical protein